MDSIKFLDEIIAYQQHKDDKYPVKEHTLTQLSIRVNKNMQDNINSLMAEHGINDAMFMLMSLLSTSDNFCMSPSDISNVLQFSKTNVTRISDSLVTKGFIRRVDSRNDRRSKYIHLTPEGDLFLQRVTRIKSLYLEKIWSVLSDDEINSFEIVRRKLLSLIDNI